MTEPIRCALSVIHGALAPLSKEERSKVFESLQLVLAKTLTAQDKEVEKLRDELEEWKKHNEQRLVETYEARELVCATPNETLPAALSRWLTNQPLA